MNILIADDELYLRKELIDTLEEIIPGNDYFEAGNYSGAVKILQDNSFDIAFLDINMPGRNGLELAEKIKDLSPSTKIIFVTAFSDYAVDAFRLFADGYLLKPVIEKDLKALLDHVLKQTEAGTATFTVSKLTVTCFGNFEVFFNNKPLSFSRSLGKEIFAYLIALQGASATRAEILSVLFPESLAADQAAFRFKTSLSSLRKDLANAGFEDVLIHNKNAYAINKELVQCDYYEYLADRQNPRYRYQGEFMKQYSWAEEYIYGLENY